jgi:hypothetical protein
MPRQRVLPFSRLLLLVCLVCLNAALLMDLRPRKAQAGAGGIEGGNCAGSGTPDPTLDCFGGCPVGIIPVEAPDSFISASPMSTPRAFFASTPLQFDNQIPTSIAGRSCGPALSIFRFGLVTGGVIDAQGDVTNTAEVFGPLVLTSFSQQTAPTPQYDSGFLSLQFLDGGGGPGSTMSTPRTLHQATLFSYTFVPGVQNGFLASGAVLISGGSSDLKSSPHSVSALSSAEIFSFQSGMGGSIVSGQSLTFVSGTFASPISMNVARTLHQATLLDPTTGKILITGGLNEKRQALTSAEIFDPSGNGGMGTFTFTKGSMKHARFGHTATLLDDGTVLITGGYSGGEGYPNLDGSSNSNQRAPITATAEIYDPVSDTFTKELRMQVPRAGHTASRIANTSSNLAGSVLIAGGITNKGVTDTAELYTPGAGFSSVGKMQTPRFLHAASSISTGAILIVGGTNNLGTSLASAERFDPGTSKFVQITATMNSARRGFSAGADIPIEFSGVVILPGGLDSSGTPLSAADMYFPPM